MIDSKRALFENARRRWPKQTIILVGKSANGAVDTRPELWSIYQSVESSMPSDDEWNQLAAWAFHQALDKLARRISNRGVEHLNPEMVSFKSFDTMMKSNLSNEVWNDERAIYEALPST